MFYVCAEEIFLEALICRYCGKKQKTVISNTVEKIDGSFEKDRGSNSPKSFGFWILCWLPSLILVLAGFLFWPFFIIGAIYAFSSDNYIKKKYNIHA